MELSMAVVIIDNVMELIRSSYTISNQGHTLDDILKEAANVATSYGYEFPESMVSDKERVNFLIEENYLEPLQHAVVYLVIPSSDFWMIDSKGRLNGAKRFDYSYVGASVRVDFNTYDVFISTTLKVLVENNVTDDLKYLSEPKSLHSKAKSADFITSFLNMVKIKDAIVADFIGQYFPANTPESQIKIVNDSFADSNVSNLESYINSLPEFGQDYVKNNLPLSIMVKFRITTSVGRWKDFLSKDIDVSVIDWKFEREILS